jgi:tetratricopeptide (TPR) repeat protein
MDETNQRTAWSATQVYVLSLICLALGILCGYLAHVPKTAPAADQKAATQPLEQNSPQGGPQSGMRQPTNDELRKMADKKAEPVLNELKSKPNDPALLAQAGDVYLFAHQFDVARGYYEQSLQQKQDADVWVHLSSCYYFANNDPDKAIDALHSALKINPKHQLALFNLGMLEWHARMDPKAAIAAWEAFKKTNPSPEQKAKADELIKRAQMHMNLPPGVKSNKPAM